MPSVIGISLPGGIGSLSGKIFIGNEDLSSLRQLYWPPGINTLARHGSGYVYAGRNYLTGTWSANLLIDENFRVLRQGIIPPQSPPSVSAGAGSTEQICYLSYWDAISQQRSSLSEGTSITGNTTRAWTSLPTTVPGEAAVIEGTWDISGGNVTVASGAGTGNIGQARPGDRIADAAATTRWAVIRTIPDQDTATIDDTGMAAVGATLVHKPISRCTHVELWVAVAGALPRLSSRVPLGVASFNEAVGTLSLGEAFLDNFEPPPFCTMNVTYGDRQVSAGNPQNPDTLYLSNLFEHEQWGGLSFKTRFGEPIVGLVKMRDYVLVLCPESSYTLQGYTEDDLEFRVNEPDLGGLGHTTNIVIRGKAYIPNSQGYFMYNGAWHPILEDSQRAYQGIYQTYRKEYETGLVVHDKTQHSFLFIPNYDEEEDYLTKTYFQKQNIIVWRCDYTPMIGDAAGGGGQPNWSWDDHFVMGQEIKSAAYLAPTTTSLGKLVKITFDGSVWVESPTVNGPDVEIVPAHLYFGLFGGDVQKGKTLHALYSYHYGDYTTCDIEVYPGHSYAYGDDIQARLEGPNIPTGILGIPTRYPTLKLSQTNLVSTVATPIQPSLIAFPTTPDVTVPVSIAAQGDADWVLWQAQTCFAWKMGDTGPTGKGFTFKWIFRDHKLLEWYGFGGYYGPGVAQRPVNWVQFGG